MALILQDTNILLRGAQSVHAQHQETLDAQAFLRNRGDKLCIVAQNYEAAGKQNHDARLVAAMNIYGISMILTFNKSDFIRYPNITVWEPKDLLLPAS